MVKYIARLVSDIGTGPIGIDRGPRIQITAVIRAVVVMKMIFALFFLVLLVALLVI